MLRLGTAASTTLGRTDSGHATVLQRSDHGRVTPEWHADRRSPPAFGAGRVPTAAAESVTHRVQHAEASAGRTTAGDVGTGTPADFQARGAGRLLVRRDLVDRVRDGRDPLRHRDRPVEPG